MGTFSIWHLLLIFGAVVLLFGGRGKISSIMGDFGKGITSFKAGLKEGERREGEAPDSIDHARPGPTIDSSVRQDDVVRR